MNRIEGRSGWHYRPNRRLKQGRFIFWTLVILISADLIAIAWLVSHPWT